MNKSESIAKLAEALSKAQGAMRHAIKGADNPYFRSKYADLASVTDACKAELSANGLAVVQLPTMRDGKMVLEYALIHSSGEYIASEIEMTPVKADPQGIGSAITYARRYTLAGIVGVATDDDDGNAASAPADAQQTKKQDKPISFRKSAPPQGRPDEGSLPVQPLPSPAGVETAGGVLEGQTGAPPAEDIPVNGYDCIDKGQAVALHRQFRECLPKAQQKLATELLKDWLKSQGIVNILGEPSTLAVKKENYEDVKQAAIEYARDQF